MEQVSYFRKGLNQDDSPLSEEFDAVQEYLNMENLQIGMTEENDHQLITSIKSNKEVSYELPEGENKCIGRYEDTEEGRLIYFIYNSEENHSILRYNPSTGNIVELVEGAALNFDEDNFITEVSLTDQLLQWTDANDYGNGIEGNPPRYISIERAENRYGLRKYKIYFQQNDAFDARDEYRITIKKKDGTAIGGINDVLVYKVPDAGVDYEDGLSAFADAINDQAILKDYVTAEACDCYLQIDFKKEGYYTFEVDATDPDSGTPAHSIYEVADNFYSDPLFEQQFDLLKYPYNCPISGQFKRDTDVKQNQVKSKTFQFIARFVYADFEKSAWSPVSQLVFDVVNFGKEVNNYIEIDFFNDFLNDKQTLELLKYIDIGAREGNTGQWRRIKRLKPCEWKLGEGKAIYNWYNDGTYPAIPDDELSDQYDAVPRLAIAHTAAKNRGHWGGLLEGYDAVDCPDLEYEVDYNTVDQQNTWTLKGFIQIRNLPLAENQSGNDYISNQPIYDGGYELNGTVRYVFGGLGGGIDQVVEKVGSSYDQWIPEGGFIAYLAGTNHYDISKQIDNEDITIADSERNVYDGTTSSNIDDIRGVMAEGEKTIYQTFEIKNIPPGKYTLALASHWVSRGDVLNKGSMYDLDKGTAWQLTSTNVIGIGSINYGSSTKEITVDLTDPAGGTLELDYDTQKFLVGDLTDPSDLFSTTVATGYLVDAEGANGISDLADNGERVEKQRVRVNSSELDQLMTTDRNGYWFDYRRSGFSVPTSPSKVQVDHAVGITVNGLDDIIYLGGLGEMQNETLEQKKRIHGGFTHEQYIIPNTNVDFHENNRTFIDGNISDSNGDGYGQSLVVFEGTSRYDITDSEGNYRIMVYGTFLTSKRTNDSLLFASLEARSVTYSNGNESALNISPITESGFNSDNPFEASDITVTFDTELDKSYLKRGGRYLYGIVYEDRGNRKSIVNREEDDKIYIPHHTENGIYGQPTVTVEIKHTPPSYATHYRIVRTRNTANRSPLTWVLNDAKYVTRYFSEPDEDTPQETTYEAGDATEILLGFGNLTTYAEENTNSFIGFPEEVSFDFSGTRVKLIYNQDGELQDFYDLEIKGRRGEYLVVEALESLPKIEEGWMVELYDPREVNAEETDFVFFECGECHEIENGYHKGTTQDQDATQSAKVKLTTGDTYWVVRDIPIEENGSITDRYAYLMESNRVSDFYDSEYEDIGRPVLVDDDDGERFFESLSRWSNIYVGDSKVNGLSRFNALDRKEFPRDYGAIRSMRMAGNVLLIITDRKPVSVYVGEKVLSDVSGQQLVTSSEEVLGTYRVSEANYGTQNKESVVEIDTNVYWWDNYRQKYCRYSNAGVFPISDYVMDNTFAGLSEKYDKVDKSKYKVISEYDQNTEQISVLFSEATYISDEPMAAIDTGEDDLLVDEDRFVIETVDATCLFFNEKRKHWTHFKGIAPEMMGRVATEMITFKDGKLYLEYAGDDYNTFYGDTKEAVFKFVARPQGDINKFWEAIQAMSLSHSCDVTITNSEGQTSRIPKANWEKREKDYYADVLRDVNTPNLDFPLYDGDVMRSPELVIEMKWNTNERILFRSMRVVGTYSRGTLIS